MRTFALHQPMSALPPTADILQCTSACPLCAISGHSRNSFDRIVGDGKHAAGMAARCPLVGTSGVARTLCPVEVDIQQDCGDCGEHNPRIQQRFQTFRQR